MTRISLVILLRLSLVRIRFVHVQAGINSGITVPSKVCAPQVSTTNITMTTDDDWGSKENKEIFKKESLAYSAGACVEQLHMFNLGLVLGSDRQALLLKFHFCHSLTTTLN